jgi:invasion protein IalB
MHKLLAVAICSFLCSGICFAGVLLDPQFGLGENAPPAREVILAYTPWTKVCSRQNSSSRADDICLTVKEAYSKTGEFFGSAALVGDAQKIKFKLRTILPLGVNLTRGARMVVDKERPVEGVFSVCFPNGCMAEFEVRQETLNKFNSSDRLVIETFDAAGKKPGYLVFPLSGFQAVNSGTPISPEEFEARQAEFKRSLESATVDGSKR